jgi:hypothetical protein
MLERVASGPKRRTRKCRGLGPISLRSVSGAIQHTVREVLKLALQNRFSYWDLEERCA